MIDIIYLNTTYSLPENWNEIPNPALLPIIRLIENEKNPHKLRLQLFYHLTEIPLWRLLNADPERLGDALSELDWMFEKEINLTENKLPCLHNLYGPSSFLGNLTMNEFAYSEKYFFDFKLSPDNKALASLCAILYRPAKTNYDQQLNQDGDIRTEFKADTIPYYSDLIYKNWKAEEMLAVATFYEGCRNSLYEPNSELFDGDGKEDDLSTAIYRIIRHLAGDKYGTLNEVGNLYVHNAMLEMKLIAEEAIMYKNNSNDTTQL